MDFFSSDYFNEFENDGFLVPKLELEMPLYRYRGNFEHIADEIANDHVFLSPLDMLNDPFDSSCSMSIEEVCQEKNPLALYFLGSYFLRRLECYDELEAFINDLVAHQVERQYVTLEEFSIIVSEFIKTKGRNIKPIKICQLYYEMCCSKPEQRKSFGKVVSFSETWESIPMWAYYANSHKGVCMKYEFDKLDSNNSSNQKIKNNLHKVWYSDYRFNDPQGRFTPFVKSLQWAHEQEWRLFGETDEKFLHIPCLTEIYLGINFDNQQFDLIVNELEKKERKIKLFQIYTKPNKYELERVRIN